MVPSNKNRVGMSVTGTPGTGTIALDAAVTDAANGDHVSFGATYAGNAIVDCLYTDGHNWSIERDCAYTHAGTTITRGTVEATWNGSALNTSALSLTNGAKVYVVNSADRIKSAIDVSFADIHGYNLEWLAATGSIIRAKAGHAIINGTRYEDTGAITTLTGDTALSADKIYNVYLYNDSGTRKLELDLRVTASDDPEYDTALDYWKAPNTTQFTAHASGVGRAGFRWIGYFYTWNNGGTANCEPFVCVGSGRERSFSSSFKSTTMHRFVSGATASSWTSVDISASKPISAFSAVVSAYASASSAGDMVVGVSSVYVSGATTSDGNYLFRAYTASGGFGMGVPSKIPLDGTTLYWIGVAATGAISAAYVQHVCFDCRV